MFLKSTHYVLYYRGILWERLQIKELNNEQVLRCMLKPVLTHTQYTQESFRVSRPLSWYSALSRHKAPGILCLRTAQATIHHNGWLALPRDSMLTKRGQPRSYSAFNKWGLVGCTAISPTVSLCERYTCLEKQWRRGIDHFLQNDSFL